MSSERVTVSLSDDVRRAAQRIAEKRGTSFSAVVAEALTSWMRGRLVDAWLAEHQAAHGEFDENELRKLVADAGVPYVKARAAGELLAATGSADVVDALLALLPVPGDQLLTSDPDDLRSLVGSAASR